MKDAPVERFAGRLATLLDEPSGRKAGCHDGAAEDSECPGGTNGADERVYDEAGDGSSEAASGEYDAVS